MQKMLPNSSIVKMDNSSNMNQNRLSAILSKPRKEPNRITKIEMITSQSLLYESEVLELCKFKVPESGYYNISNQTCIRCDESATISVMQYGICDRDLNEFGSCLESQLVNSTAPKNTIMSKNLSTFKQLEADLEYIVWVNVSSGNNKGLTFMHDYSHCMIIKL